MCFLGMGLIFGPLCVPAKCSVSTTFLDDNVEGGWMVCQVCCDIKNLIVDNHPAAFLSGVFGHLGTGQGWT